MFVYSVLCWLEIFLASISIIQILILYSPNNERKKNDAILTWL